MIYTLYNPLRDFLIKDNNAFFIDFYGDEERVEGNIYYCGVDVTKNIIGDNNFALNLDSIKELTANNAYQDLQLNHEQLETLEQEIKVRITKWQL